MVRPGGDGESRETPDSVTTALLNQRHLDRLAAELGPDDALLVYCTRRALGLRIPDGIEVKKIPRDLLAKCTFEEGK